MIHHYSHPYISNRTLLPGAIRSQAVSFVVVKRSTYREKGLEGGSWEEDQRNCNLQSI